MLLEDDITRFLITLRNLRSGFLEHSNSQVKSCVGYLDSAISRLESYRAEEKYYTPKPRSESDRDIFRKGVDAWETNTCGSGRHWVRRKLKNGKNGFCRRNPKRRSA